ncbi:MAG: hypothetical protein ACO35C_04970, partial [Pontimonas sp.]
MQSVFYKTVGSHAKELENVAVQQTTTTYTLQNTARNARSALPPRVREFHHRKQLAAQPKLCFVAIDLGDNNQPVFTTLETEITDRASDNYVRFFGNSEARHQLLGALGIRKPGPRGSTAYLAASRWDAINTKKVQYIFIIAQEKVEYLGGRDYRGENLVNLLAHLPLHYQMQAGRQHPVCHWIQVKISANEAVCLKSQYLPVLSPYLTHGMTNDEYDQYADKRIRQFLRKAYN